MNTEMLKSLVYKLLPVVVSYLVGRGILTPEAAEHLPTLVDWVIVGAVLVPTFIRSLKTHKVIDLPKAQ